MWSLSDMNGNVYNKYKGYNSCVKRFNPRRLCNGQRTCLEMGQAKNYKAVCFCAVALSSKFKDWLLRNKDIACDWSDISTCGMLFE